MERVVTASDLARRIYLTALKRYPAAVGRSTANENSLYGPLTAIKPIQKLCNVWSFAAGSRREPLEARSDISFRWTPHDTSHFLESFFRPTLPLCSPLFSLRAPITSASDSVGLSESNLLLLLLDFFGEAFLPLLFSLCVLVLSPKTKIYFVLSNSAFLSSFLSQIFFNQDSILQRHKIKLKFETPPNSKFHLGGAHEQHRQWRECLHYFLFSSYS